MNNKTAAVPQQVKTAPSFFPAPEASFFAPAPQPAVQKAPTHVQPARIQRTPEDTGAMHEDLADEYRSSHGLTEEEGFSTGRIVYQLSDPVFVLNNEPHTSRLYSATVVAWPNTRAIWPVLNSPGARVTFVRYILQFDQTNCRPYHTGDASGEASCEATATALQTFENVCQGYATQMYTRYTSAPRADADTSSRLSSIARIDVGDVPVKFHIPIFIASVPGHAFNAVQISTDPADIHSYIFFEPQNDQVFTGDSATLRSGIYASAGMVTLSRLTSFNETGQYDQQDTHTFIIDSNNTFTGLVLSLEERLPISRIMGNIFIADDIATWRTLQASRPGTTYETIISETISNISDAILARVFPFLNGRRFRRTPGGVLETMDRTIFLSLMNRPALESLIP